MRASHFVSRSLRTHYETVRDLQRQIKKVRSFRARDENGKTLNLEEYAQLCKMAEAESRTLSSLATRMRLTQQSIYSARKGRGTQEPRKPWEEDHE